MNCEKCGLELNENEACPICGNSNKKKINFDFNLWKENLISIFKVIKNKVKDPNYVINDLNWYEVGLLLGMIYVIHLIFFRLPLVLLTSYFTKFSGMGANIFGEKIKISVSFFSLLFYVFVYLLVIFGLKVLITYLKTRKIIFGRAILVDFSDFMIIPSLFALMAALAFLINLNLALFVVLVMLLEIIGRLFSLLGKYNYYLDLLLKTLIVIAILFLLYYVFGNLIRNIIVKIGDETVKISELSGQIIGKKFFGMFS